MASLANSLLAGRQAVITGGSSGIGLAIARRFAASGAACVLVGRDEARLRAAVSQFPSATATAPSIIVGDVTSVDTWDRISKIHPQADIFVNAAGLSQSSLLVRTPEAEIDSLLRVNLKGTILGCKTAASMMTRSCIINISSLLAERGGRGATVYAATKAGILGLTRSLTTELGRSGIRVNAIVPGYISGTKMTPDLDEKTLRSIPLMRMGMPEDVADAASFLALNEYASNCVVHLDGGLSAV